MLLLFYRDRQKKNLVKHLTIICKFWKYIFSCIEFLFRNNDADDKNTIRGRFFLKYYMACFNNNLLYNYIFLDTVNDLLFKYMCFSLNINVLFVIMYICIVCINVLFVIIYLTCATLFF